MKIFSLLILLTLLTSCTTFRWTGKGNGPPDDPDCYYSKDDPKYEHYPCPNDSADAGTSPGFVESHHPNEVELDKKYFVVSYNPKHRLPNWVSYKRSTFHVSIKAGKRRDKFFADPELVKRKLAYARPGDFDGKIYDRGHLAPSEDIVWSQEANDATFVMSNMTPQKRALNRGSWKKLEAKVRGWACTEKELTVVSGPFLTDDLPKFKSGVSIPKKFFKIVIDETAPRKAIAFIYDQEDGKKDLRSAVTSVGNIENQTGFEFIISPDTIERDQLTKKFDLNQWKTSDCGEKKVAKQ